MNRVERRSSAKMSPARRRKRAAQRAAYRQPDATERVVQELNHRMRAELRARPAEHGAVSGPLAVAADYAARPLAEQAGLDLDEHRQAIAEWLTAAFGQVLRDFPLQQEAYLRWRYRHVEGEALDG